jgi:hypothetical protein
LAAAALGILIWLFVETDLSVKLVAENSHSAKPLIYKIAGTWGNHEGSMLLWVTVMGLGGAFVAAVERRLPEPTMMATLAGRRSSALVSMPSCCSPPTLCAALSGAGGRQWFEPAASGSGPRVSSAYALSGLCRSFDRVFLCHRCADHASGRA